MKKICSLLLAFCLCVTMAAGCTKSDDKSASSSQALSSSEASSQKEIVKTTDYSEAINQKEEFQGVSYQIPGAWEKSENDAETNLYSPKAGGTMLVGIVSDDKDFDLSSETTAKICADSIQSQFEGTDNGGKMQMTQVGENVAIRFSFSTSAFGASAQMNCLMFNVPEGVYGFFLATPDDGGYNYDADYEQIIKSIEIPQAKAHTAGEPVDIVKSDAKIGTLTINSVTKTDKRNQFAEGNPAQVVIIDFTYENTASEDDLYLFSSYFQVIDSGGNVCTTHPLTGLTHGQKAPIGAKSTGQEAYNLTVEIPQITLIYKPNMFDNKDAITFEIPVQ